MHPTLAHLFILGSRYMTLLKKNIDTIFSLAIGLFLTFIVGLLILDDRENKFSLNPPTANQSFYILGNSMFGTGFDLGTFREAFPKNNTEFAYYNGYYTSMWHLAVNVGMNKDNAPDTIIWGFRPTYAITPSFRQNVSTDEQILSLNAPNVHNEILKRAGDPAFLKEESLKLLSSDVDKFSNNEEIAMEPFEITGAILIGFIKAQFNAMNGEQGLRDLVINLFSKLLSNNEMKDDNDDLIKSSDLLIRYVTGGKITSMDALVVDNGEKFIKGDEADFSDSFIPSIVDAIERIGSNQLVVIFRPVSTFQEPLPKNTEQFYKDAVKYLERNAINYIDLMDNQSLTKDMYAKGDHLTEEGRKLITKLIIDEAKLMNRNQKKVDRARKETGVNSSRSNQRANCLDLSYVALSGAEFNISSEQTTKNEQKFVVQVPSKTYADKVRCIFNGNKIENFILNGSKMSSTIRPRLPLQLGVFTPFKKLTHRPFTSTTKDNAIIKYFMKFDFIAPKDEKYCVVLRHKSPNERKNSIKIGTDRNNLSIVNLPVTGNQVKDHIINTVPLNMKAEEKISLWMTHRENTFTYGVSMQVCN